MLEMVTVSIGKSVGTHSVSQQLSYMGDLVRDVLQVIGGHSIQTPTV